MPGVGAAVGSITRFMFKMRSTMLHFSGVPPWHVCPFGQSSLKKEMKYGRGRCVKTDVQSRAAMAQAMAQYSLRSGRTVCLKAAVHPSKCPGCSLGNVESTVTGVNGPFFEENSVTTHVRSHSHST